ncbi:hypothetical protein ACFQQB_67155 [Nonomuraea rubra]|uniref:hypothetical protein n=1 Tax=Nonomuraea rubra TaxID=46180 RepID=UPI0036086C92
MSTMVLDVPDDTKSATNRASVASRCVLPGTMRFARSTWRWPALARTMIRPCSSRPASPAMPLAASSSAWRRATTVPSSPAG